MLHRKGHILDSLTEAEGTLRDQCQRPPGGVLRTELRARGAERGLKVADACAQGRDGRGAIGSGRAAGRMRRDEQAPAAGV